MDAAATPAAVVELHGVSSLVELQGCPVWLTLHAGISKTLYRLHSDVKQAAPCSAGPCRIRLGGRAAAAAQHPGPRLASCAHAPEHRLNTMRILPSSLKWCLFPVQLQLGSDLAASVSTTFWSNTSSMPWSMALPRQAGHEEVSRSTQCMWQLRRGYIGAKLTQTPAPTQQM